MIFLIGLLGVLLFNGIIHAGSYQFYSGYGYRGSGGNGAYLAVCGLYASIALCHANNLLNMGILISLLIVPLISGALAMLFVRHANYAFLLALGVRVTYTMFRWLLETRPALMEKRCMLASFQQLIGRLVPLPVTW